MTRRIVSAELEERTLRVVVAQGTGRRLRVLRHGSYTLANDDALVPTVQSVLAGGSSRDCELLLALRHRRVTSGEVVRVETPCRPQEMVPLLVAEARKLGVYGQDEDLVVGYRMRAARGLWAGVCVAPSDLVQPIAARVRALGFARVRMLASDAVLAHALTRDGDDVVAVLDVQGDRAMLALAQAGRVLATRHFKLGMPHVAHPDNGHEVAPLVFGELMRSIGFFAEQGRGEAKRVLVSGPFAASGGLVEVLQGLVPLDVAAAPVPAAPGFAGDTAEARGLLVPRLALLCAAGDIAHLIEPERPSWARVAAVAALQLAAGAAGAYGVTMLARTHAPHTEALIEAADHLRGESMVLQNDIETLRVRLQPSPVVRVRSEILAALDGQRAARSALCAAIARGRPQTLSLTRLELDDEGTLTLTGIARTDDRLTALRELADYEAYLRRVPGLGSGRSSLGETDGGQQIAFTFAAKLAQVGP